MPKLKIALLLLAAVSIMTVGISAQTIGMRTYVEVDHTGSAIKTESRELSSPPTPSEMDSTQPGLVWNRSSGSLNWMARDVSVGDFGTQALSVVELNNERIELFSCFDQNPPTPVWIDNSIFETDMGYMCDSARSSDFHVAMYHVNTPDTTHRIPHVHAYTSSSMTPIWKWNYETPINYGTRVSVDRDATVVAVGIYDNYRGAMELYFLDPADGHELSHFTQAQDGLRGWDLSADGSTLYFHDGTTVYIYDIATSTIVFSTNTQGSFDSHCISGDGSKFAFGGFGMVKIWENLGAVWSGYTHGLGSGNYCSIMDFSDDGTTLGFGVYYYTTGAKSAAYMMDVATKTITVEKINNSNGYFQDLPCCAAISHDGKYFALGRWGDQMSANPEVQILENHVGVVGSVDTRGSVFSIDIAHDGQVTVSGGKAVHANTFGNGGDVDCYNLGGEDLGFYGSPIIGNDVSLDVHTGADWYYMLMLCNAADPEGVEIFPFGTLYLDPTRPSVFWVFPMMQAGADGVGTNPFQVCDDPSLVGQTVYFQAIFSEDGAHIELSNDYVTCTLLPK